MLDPFALHVTKLWVKNDCLQRTVHLNTVERQSIERTRLKPNVFWVGTVERTPRPNTP